MRGEAGMAELADANDSRSFERKLVRVQVPLPAQTNAVRLCAWKRCACAHRARDLKSVGIFREHAKCRAGVAKILVRRHKNYS